jgi:serine/threonine-protein kinase RCK2
MHHIPQDAPSGDQQQSPDHREAAEMIVSEERDAKAKLPTYVGLENFKLLDKMGE